MRRGPPDTGRPIYIIRSMRAGQRERVEMTSSGRSLLESSFGPRWGSFQATSSAYFDTMTALSTGLGTRPLGSSRLAFDRLHRRAVPRAAYRQAPQHHRCRYGSHHGRESVNRASIDIRTSLAPSVSTVLIRESRLSVSDEHLGPEWLRGGPGLRR